QNNLKNIHSAGLIHKDIIHLGNILQVSNEVNITTHLSGLGLPKRISGLDISEEIFGVVSYVVPEVLLGQRYTMASDVYSLGVISANVNWKVII
ncbi:14296_t:CDS:1, partial [Racocetra fulgida]